MSWVLWDIITPLLLTFGLGLSMGWLLWRWRREQLSGDAVVAADGAQAVDNAESESADGEETDTDDAGSDSAAAKMESINAVLIAERDEAVERANAAESSLSEAQVEILKLKTELSDQATGLSDEDIDNSEKFQNLVTLLAKEQEQRAEIELELTEASERRDLLERELDKAKEVAANFDEEKLTTLQEDLDLSQKVIEEKDQQYLDSVLEMEKLIEDRDARIATLEEMLAGEGTVSNDSGSDIAVSDDSVPVDEIAAETPEQLDSENSTVTSDADVDTDSSDAGIAGDAEVDNIPDQPAVEETTNSGELSSEDSELQVSDQADDVQEQTAAEDATLVESIDSMDDVTEAATDSDDTDANTENATQEPPETQAAVSVDDEADESAVVDETLADVEDPTANGDAVETEVPNADDTEAVKAVTPDEPESQESEAVEVNDEQPSSSEAVVVESAKEPAANEPAVQAPAVQEPAAQESVAKEQLISPATAAEIATALAEEFDIDTVELQDPANTENTDELAVSDSTASINVEVDAANEDSADEAEGATPSSVVDPVIGADASNEPSVEEDAVAEEQDAVAAEQDAGAADSESDTVTAEAVVVDEEQEEAFDTENGVADDAVTESVEADISQDNDSPEVQPHASSSVDADSEVSDDAEAQASESANVDDQPVSVESAESLAETEAVASVEVGEESGDNAEQSVMAESDDSAGADQGPAPDKVEETLSENSDNGDTTDSNEGSDERFAEEPAEELVSDDAEVVEDNVVADEEVITESSTTVETQQADDSAQASHVDEVTEVGGASAVAKIPAARKKRTAAKTAKSKAPTKASAKKKTARRRTRKTNANGYAPKAWEVPLRPPAEKNRDQLTDIKGVGPVLEGLLHDSGIYHFRQVALLDSAGVNELQEQLPQFPGRIKRDKWVSQAKALHRKKYGVAAKNS